MITALLLALWTTLAPMASSQAALYKPGDSVTDFTFIARRPFKVSDTRTIQAGQPVRLSDMAGKIVFLEWFAVWCTYCAAAAPQVVTGIEDHYSSPLRGGKNPHGIPVVHVAVNQESRANFQAGTETFIDRYRFRHVVNDYTSTSVNDVRFKFQSSGQPIFVVISGVTNSPTHKPWEVLVNHLGYGDRDFNLELANFRSRIDAVQAPPPPPLLLSTPQVASGANPSFTVQAPAGTRIDVQHSEDLSSWTLLQSIDGTGEPVVVTDPNPSPAQRYYRAIQTPAP
ncbi:MAG: TlpA family protein disulfide reductase [Verrucomicrobia bacterium]|nr:TlpA family protein disulfide reductase [Verrucomicrobiota bacterium]